MSVSEQVTLAWLALRGTLAKVMVARLWVPWLLLGTVQVAVLMALWWFAHPWVSWLAAPALTRVAGENALHFPRALAILPSLYGRVDLLIGTFLGALVIGAATHLFADQFRGRSPALGAASATTLRRAFALVVAQLPLNGLLFVLGMALERLGAQSSHGGARQLVVAAAGWTLPVVVQACFLFVVPLMVIEGRGVVRAMRELPGVWRRGFWAGVFMGVAVLVPLLPFQFLGGGSAIIVERGDPDLVAWLTLVQIGVGLLVNFTLTGGSAVYYLSALSERDE